MAHFCYYRENPPEKNVFDFGRIFHLAALEPDKLNKAVAIWGGDKRGKAWTEFKEKNSNKTIIKHDEYVQIITMAAAIKAHPIASAIINHQQAEIEQSIFWIDQDTGEKCKCRPDVRIESEGLIADLKGVQSAQPGMFSRACANYGYQYQAPFYLDGAIQATGVEHKHFVFIAVEKEPPHLVAVYEADYEFIEVGRMKYKELLLQYSQCKIENHWPGYGDGIKEISLPRWTVNFE